MANEIRCTFFFEDVGASRHVGWSEVLWQATADPNLSNGLAKATALAKLRAKLMGQDILLQYVRLSHEGVYRDSLVYQAALSGSSVSNKGGAILTPADFASSCLLLRMESGDKARRSMYLSGNPDGVQIITSLPTDPEWMRSFQNWKTEVVANWAYFGLVKDPATNKAPKRVVNPSPPPKYTPRPQQLYPISNVIVRSYSTRKRGRPFDLYRGRRKATSA